VVWTETRTSANVLPRVAECSLTTGDLARLLVASDSKLLRDKDSTLLVLITTLLHSLASYLVV
jgi:hypothetical protein